MIKNLAELESTCFGDYIIWKGTVLMNENQHPARKANLELLRIVLMIGIVFGHGFLWGGVQDKLVFPSALYCIVRVLHTIEIPSVNCFVMLSGYFLITAEFKISRILKFWLQVIFYSVVLYLLLAIFGLSTFSIKSFVISFSLFIFKRFCN